MYLSRAHRAHSNVRVAQAALMRSVGSVRSMRVTIALTAWLIQGFDILLHILIEGSLPELLVLPNCMLLQKIKIEFSDTIDRLSVWAF